MALVTRPSGSYTPSNAITNTTKYQDDSAAVGPRVAISSAKVDGDINKAFDVLTNHDNALDDHESRIDSLETNPVSSFSDSTFEIKDDGDATKKIKFQASGISTATTRTLGIQDVDGTVIVTGGADIAIADGGTGASTVVAARTNLELAGEVIFKKLKLINNSSTPNTKVDVTADAAVLKNNTGGCIRHAPISVTIDAGTTGANGLDTGSLANSTWYYLFLISDGTTVAGLASTSATAPTLPNGYTFVGRCGAFVTDGSAHFKRIIQRENKAKYVVTSGSNTANLPIMASGSSGSTATPTWTSIAVGSYISPTASDICVTLQYNGSSSAAMVAPNDQYGAYTSNTNPPPLVCAVGSSAMNIMGELTLESTNIYWASGGTNNRVLCCGWTDNL